VESSADRKCSVVRDFHADRCRRIGIHSQGELWISSASKEDSVVRAGSAASPASAIFAIFADSERSTRGNYCRRATGGGQKPLSPLSAEKAEKGLRRDEHRRSCSKIRNAQISRKASVSLPTDVDRNTRRGGRQRDDHGVGLCPTRCRLSFARGRIRAERHLLRVAYGARATQYRFWFVGHSS
jgi:hypothetical protein